jgi:hypothetical protein
VLGLTSQKLHLTAISPQFKIKEKAWIIIHNPCFSYLYGYTIYRGTGSVIKPVIIPTNRQISVLKFAAIFDFNHSLPRFEKPVDFVVISTYPDPLCK